MKAYIIEDRNTRKEYPTIAHCFDCAINQVCDMWGIEDEGNLQILSPQRVILEAAHG